MEDLDSRYVRVNRVFADLVGLTPEEVVGKTDFDFFPADVAKSHQAYDREVLNSGQAIEKEQTTPCIDGPHDEIVRKLPFHHDDGTLVGLLGVTTDITSRKRAEKVAREVSIRLEQVANNLRGAVVYQAIESAQDPLRIVWISPGVESLIGVPSDEVTTDIRKLIRFANPEDAVEHRRKRGASIRSGTPFEVLIRFHLPGGETRWIQDHCSPLPQEDGSTLWHGVAVDMTSQELAKQKLAEQELMLRQLGENLPSARRVAEREMLLATLQATNNNRTKAAAALGVSRMTRYKRMERLSISHPKVES